MHEPHLHESTLPAGIALLERGWLSSNSVLLTGLSGCVLIDSGHLAHASQTLGLVQKLLGDRQLDRLINTHLHSDHCGGNAILQRHYAGLQTLVGPGQAGHVQQWRTEHLPHVPTGQPCERFKCDAILEPGKEIELASRRWLPLPAPGHDPHALMLWCEEHRLLISADALWENGFGIVFPELIGESGFQDVAKTLDQIEQLHPQTVLPGHGQAFSDAPTALKHARARLEKFKANPAAHHQHAIKALIKFMFLEWGTRDWADVCAWLDKASMIKDALIYGLEKGYAPTATNGESAFVPIDDTQHWIANAIEELTRQGQLTTAGTQIMNQ